MLYTEVNFRLVKLRHRFGQIIVKKVPLAVETNYFFEYRGRKLLLDSLCAFDVSDDHTLLIRLIVG